MTPNGPLNQRANVIRPTALSELQRKCIDTFDPKRPDLTLGIHLDIESMTFLDKLFTVGIFHRLLKSGQICYRRTMPRHSKITTPQKI